MEKNIKTASKGVRSMYEWLEEIVFALVAVILVFTFLFRVVTVTGKSMLPNFVEGEKVVVTNLGHDIEQGTVVVVTNVLEEPIIKRVIATEGPDSRYRLRHRHRVYRQRSAERNAVRH